MPFLAPFVGPGRFFNFLIRNHWRSGDAIAQLKPLPVLLLSSIEVSCLHIMHGLGANFRGQQHKLLACCCKFQFAARDVACIRILSRAVLATAALSINIVSHNPDWLLIGNIGVHPVDYVFGVCSIALTSALRASR